MRSHTSRSLGWTRIVVAVAVMVTGLVVLDAAPAYADAQPPTAPAYPRWSDATGVMSETVSGETTLTAAWNVATDEDGGSGLGQYRVQVAESPDFAVVSIDRYTGSAAATQGFTAADGVAVGHSYYFRVLGVDVAGNHSAWSGPSNRVDVSDRTVGPEIVHAPVMTAFYGRAIPIDFSATCEGGGPCGARLFWRTTSSASTPAGAWQRAEVPGVVSLTRINNTDTLAYSGMIPGWAVTTAGVDYYIEAEDSYALSYFPGTPMVDASAVSGVQGVSLWHHVQTITPPLLTHQPPPYAQAASPSI